MRQGVSITPHRCGADSVLQARALIRVNTEAGGLGHSAGIRGETEEKRL